MYDIDAACACGSAQNAKPVSYGRFSHLCPSTAQESAAPRPATRCSSVGLAAAHRPNAPSTCTHAPCRCAASHATARSSNAPVFTFPACTHTIVGAREPASIAATRAPGSTAPLGPLATDTTEPAPIPSSRSARSIVA